MNFTVLTIFPEMFDSFWAHGIIRRAIEHKIISASTINIRDYATDRHQMTDDRPYGGGSGMVMKPEPLAGAIRTAMREMPVAGTVLLTPQGKPFDQKLARGLATLDGLVLICGRYEGVDERICHDLIDYEISIGDYVITGGELAAMIIVDAVTRLIPDALGGQDAAQNDSFSNGLLEHAHYTRPRKYEGREVPEVLRSGHHQEIERWRLESSLMRTLLKRSDLLRQKNLDRKEIEILEKWQREINKVLELHHEKEGKTLTG
jgi:tRNA (guanine37-N1)-methyltransferase